MTKYNAVVCAIAKNENLYINDWVNWYLSIGFDHIYLFDNNNSTSEYVGNFIQEIDKVTIYDVKDQKMNSLQAKCYNTFYGSERHNFKWCLFCDIDEFLFGIKNITDFLTNPKFDDFDQILINWKTFTDNNLIERNLSIPVYEAFKEVSDNKYLNFQVKCIVRGGLDHLSIGVHNCRKNIDGKSYSLNNCLSDGVKCEIIENHKVLTIPEGNIFINHYRTKSLKEFIDQKLNRGNACLIDKKIDFDYYWISNKRTSEKEEFIKNYINQ